MTDVYPGDWPLGSGRVIRLITQGELHRLQHVEPDTILVKITGGEVFARNMDDDVRYGFIAAGFVVVVPQYRCTDDEKVLYLAKGKE